MTTQAVQKGGGVKENRQGYHWAMFATPLKTMKIPPVTRARIPSRSTASATRRPGGNDTNRGHTTQSLATSTGREAMPLATCSPCVNRNRPAGRGGAGRQGSGGGGGGGSRPGGE